MSTQDIRTVVKEKYGQAAVQVTQGGALLVAAPVPVKTPLRPICISLTRPERCPLKP